ncbi:HAD hydrolase-like protein [Nocardioides bruguierae]|uniref:HAD hydrolase-like protein n=1 Tax=Nocardioides bruguierae TaxID=2945102 RepID=UPI0020223100|nr:HAD hydrolase-like protein [Nocardioides bruguierae]MCL8024173.1 HAD hydrolase-like protein [Nocardioides bruguierae]
MPAPLVVGFDLDMTLVDSRPGIAAVLEALAAELGVEIPVHEVTSHLGPPLDQLLAPYLPAEEIDAAVDRFRALYPDLAVAATPTLAGASEAVAAVRAHGGSVLVVTGKHEPNARRHLDHLGLEVDTLAGDVWGPGKGAALGAAGAGVYVGDHVHDVAGARAADALSVSVLTGPSSREQVLDAGTDVVLDDLTGFPAWLDSHVLTSRLADLEERLVGLGSVLVAFSGGADSALLLAAAVRALGPERVVAATGYSHALPAAERDPAREFAEGLGVRVLTPATHELEREGYRANAGDRCFFCKTELMDVLVPLAAEHGLAAVATGTNADDLAAGFRPGIRAAADAGAVRPLADAGLTKAQVRAASLLWGLPTWDKPAAACLSSRIAYGVEVTAAGLARVEAAERGLRALLAEAGTPVRDLRVRDLGADAARVELDADLARRLAAGDPLAERVRAAVLAVGFADAEVDPRGFRSGAMNELLPDPERWR